jgi:hypothetical protein
VENLVGMYAFKPQGNLNEPVDDDFLRDRLLSLLMVLDEESEVALLTIFHYDDEYTFLQKVLVVLHDEYAVESFQDFYLSYERGLPLALLTPAPYLSCLPNASFWRRSSGHPNY